MQLTENLLREAAGWDVMKQARFYLGQGRVVSSFWSPPLLRGVVRDGEASFRASLVIKSQVDMRISAPAARRASGEKFARMASPSGCTGCGDRNPAPSRPRPRRRQNPPRQP